MKQQIMEKLFNGANDLTGAELTYIGKNLLEEGEGSAPSSSNGVSGFLPFNHKLKDTVFACGLTQEDVDSVNALLHDIQNRHKEGEFKSASEIIQEIEKISLRSDVNHRGLMMHLIGLMAAANRNPLVDILKMLGGKRGRKSEDEEDFD